jgi:leader peptidase (prepilin peptidase)/N-methyltransferase
MMTFLLGVLGLLVGGFVNHLGVALVTEDGLAAPRCAYCSTVRPWYHWLALPASLVRRDRCASCDAPLPIRSPLIEIGLGVTFAYLWIVTGPSARLPLYLVYSTVFALILVTDLQARLIPNVVIYPAILLGIAAPFLIPTLDLGIALAGGFIGLATYALIALLGRLVFGSGAMGWGDVKLAAFIGLITGFPMVIVAIIAAILSAGAISLLLLATRLRGRRDPIPYAPFLVLGAAVASLWGPAILWPALA